MLHHEHSRVINLYHDSVTLQSGGMLIILSLQGGSAATTDQIFLFFVANILVTQLPFCGNL